MFLPSRLMSVFVQILQMQGRKQLDSQKPNSMRFGARRVVVTRTLGKSYFEGSFGTSAHRFGSL